MTPNPSEGFQQTLMIFSGSRFRVSDGIAEGQPLSFSGELFLDDNYRLLPESTRTALSLIQNKRGEFIVALGSQTGTAGNQIVPDSVLTLMSRMGQVIELLVLVEVANRMAVEVFLMPLTPLHTMERYRLLSISRERALSTVQNVPLLIFAEGTRLVDSTGRTKPIEDFNVGEGIMTAGGRPSQIHGRLEIRPTAEECPPLLHIPLGVFDNTAPLLLSAQHRVHAWLPDTGGQLRHSETPLQALLGRNGITARAPLPLRFYQIILNAHRPVMIGPVGFDTTFHCPAPLQHAAQ